MKKIERIKKKKIKKKSREKKKKKNCYFILFYFIFFLLFILFFLQKNMSEDSQDQRIQSLTNDLEWMRHENDNIYITSKILAVPPLTASDTISRERPKGYTGPIRTDEFAIITQRALQTRAVIYAVSGFEKWALDELLDWCVGPEMCGNCDAGLWDMIGRLGFWKTCFPSGTHLLSASLATDLMWAPLFPGGHRLLLKRKFNVRDEIREKLEKELEPEDYPQPGFNLDTHRTILAAQPPSAAIIRMKHNPMGPDPKYHNSSICDAPLADRKGGIIFPMNIFMDPALLRSFFADYFETLLKHLWCLSGVKILPRLKYGASPLPPEISPMRQIHIDRISVMHFLFGLEIIKITMAKGVDRIKTYHKKVADSSVSPAQISGCGSTGNLHIGNIEDLPACAIKAIKNVKARGDHPVYKERRLLFPLFAFRVPKEELSIFARSLDIDLKGTGHSDAMAIKKKTTPWCSSTISSGMCPYSSDAKRTEECFKFMPPNIKFHSPVFLLGKRKGASATADDGGEEDPAGDKTFSEWDTALVDEENDFE